MARRESPDRMTIGAAVQSLAKRATSVRIRREKFGAADLAEGEELGSNILRPEWSAIAG
jgi:hypothetical protein